MNWECDNWECDLQRCSCCAGTAVPTHLCRPTLVVPQMYPPVHSLQGCLQGAPQQRVGGPWHVQSCGGGAGGWRRRGGAWRLVIALCAPLLLHCTPKSRRARGYCCPLLHKKGRDAQATPEPNSAQHRLGNHTARQSDAVGQRFGWQIGTGGNVLSQTHSSLHLGSELFAASLRFPAVNRIAGRSSPRYLRTLRPLPRLTLPTRPSAACSARFPLSKNYCLIFASQCSS